MAKKFTTVKDVELARVGTWAASTGTTPLTLADLESMVSAYESGDLTSAPIKIGHLDPRFNEIDPELDGEPAYGQVSNLRVSDDRGGTLLGDYVNVPEALAEVLASAYPHRSIEAELGVELLDAEGEVIAEYAAVLTGIALLGATPPAVEGLSDVHASFSAARTGQTVKRGRRTKISSASMFSAPARAAFSFPGGHTQETLREALYAALGELRASDDDPYVDRWLEDWNDTTLWHHENGQMMQRTYSVDDSGAVTLTGDPIPVVVRRVFEPAPVADTAPVPQGAAPTVESAHVAASQAATLTPTEGEAEMAFTASQLTVLRTQFGLADTATEDDVLAAIDAAAPTPEPAPAAAPEAAAPAAAPAADPAAEATPEEPTPSVQLSAANFAAMQASNARLEAKVKALTAKDDKERRDKAVSIALSSGRLHPTEEKAWREALDSNEAGTMALLSARVPAFPTQEVGSDHAPHAIATSKAVAEAQFAADDAILGKGGK